MTRRQVLEGPSRALPEMREEGCADPVAELEEHGGRGGGVSGRRFDPIVIKKGDPEVAP